MDAEFGGMYASQGHAGPMQPHERKLSKFLIMFDNSNLLYFPGQFLSGRVIVELVDEMAITGLLFHVCGEAVVNVNSNRTDRQTDKENYIDFRLRLLGEPGGVPVLLSPGIHSFPFKLGLPLGLPSTFLGKHGWVQYYCKTALKEAHTGLAHKNQQVFIVMNPIDLNQEPAILAQPFHCEIEHKLGMTCLTTGPVTCRVRLDRGGYVPGEAINIWATIDNQSKVTIKGTRSCLTEVCVRNAERLKHNDNQNHFALCLGYLEVIFSLMKCLAMSRVTQWV